MPRQITTDSNAFAILLITIFIGGLTGCINRIDTVVIKSLPVTGKNIIVPDSNWIHKIDILIPPSPLDLFACIKCHKGLKINTKRRVLIGTHKDFVFDHPGFNSENKWCYTCHDPSALDLLKLESGKLVSYQKSYEQCIQCHVKNYSYWAVGIHGRRTGMWNGEKQYLSCSYCHNAHTPKFKPVEPKKPPLKPV